MPLFVQNDTEMENVDTDSPIPSNTPSTGPVTSKNPVVTCGNKVLEIIQRHQRDARQRMEGLDQDFKSKLEKMREASRERVHNPNYKPPFMKPNTSACLPPRLATNVSSINEHSRGKISFANTSNDSDMAAQDSFKQILHAESEEYFSPPSLSFNDEVLQDRRIPLAPTPAYGNLDRSGVSISKRKPSENDDTHKNSVRFSDQMKNLSLAANFAMTKNDPIIYEPQECFCENDVFPPNNNHSDSIPSSSSRGYNYPEGPQPDVNVATTSKRQSAERSVRNSVPNQLQARARSDPHHLNSVVQQGSSDRRRVNVEFSDIALGANQSSTFLLSPPNNSQNSSVARVRTVESTRSSRMGMDTASEHDLYNHIRDDVSHRDSEEYLNGVWYYFWAVVVFVVIVVLIYGVWTTIMYFQQSLASIELDEEEPYSYNSYSGKTFAENPSNKYSMPVI